MHWLIRSGLLIICISFRCLAQQFGQPFPPNQSTSPTALPVLAWSYDSTNQLQNGSFTNGTSGWMTNGSLQLFTSTTGPNFLAGRGRLSRTIQLPDSGSILFSFVVNHTAVTALQVYSLMGELLWETSETYPLPPVGPVLIKSYDLSRFRGQAVEVVVPMDRWGDSYSVGNFKLLVGPSDTVYDVYFSQDGIQKFLGRTDGATMPTPRLKPESEYRWEVHAITSKGTNRSPVWTFDTLSLFRDAGPFIAIDGSPIASCLAEPLLLTTFATDDPGMTFPGGKTIRLVAGAEGVAPASVVITEVDFGTNDRVEFSNVSTEAVDVSNWLVELFRQADGVNPSLSLRLPSGSVLQPTELFIVREGGAMGIWPDLRLPATLDWGDSSTIQPRARVQLRDPQSNMVDCIFINTAFNPRDRARGKPIISPVDWDDIPIVEKTTAGLTYSRMGRVDRNRSSDWRLAPGTIGVANESLTHPFELGFGDIGISPSTITLSSKTGLNTTSFIFQKPGKAAVIRSLDAMRGSVPFDVVDSNHCAALIGPSTISESAGIVSFTLRLGSASQSPIEVRLYSSDLRRLPVPESIVFPGGVSVMSFNLAVPDDPFVQGPSTVELVATPAGYASANWTGTLVDDENATISIAGPSRLLEGYPRPFLISVDPAPINDVVLQVEFNPAPDLSFTNRTFVWPAGTRQITWNLGEEEKWVGQHRDMQMILTYPNWASAAHHFRYEDNDPKVIAMRNIAVTEGMSGTLDLELAGVPWTKQTIHLRSSDPIGFPVPETIEITPPSRFASVNIVVPEDANITGQRQLTVTATAEGWSSATSTVTIFDNDPSHMKIIMTPGPWQAGKDYDVELRGYTLDGILKDESDLSHANFTAEGLTNPISLAVAEGPVKTSAGWRYRVRLNQTSARVVLKAQSQTILGFSDPFPVWSNVPQVRSIAYDAIDDRFLLSQLSGSLVSVNPETGEFLNFTPEVFAPHQITLTSNSQYLYGIVADRSWIFRARLSDRSVEPPWRLPTENQPSQIHSIAAVPWRDNALAALHSSPFQRISILIDGTETFSRLTSYHPGSTLIFDPNQQYLYVVEPFKVAAHPLSPDLRLLEGEKTGTFFSRPNPIPGDVSFLEGVIYTAHFGAIDADHLGGFQTSYNLPRSLTAVNRAPGLVARLSSSGDYANLLITPPFNFWKETGQEFLGLGTDWKDLEPAGRHGWIASTPEFHILPDSTAGAAEDVLTLSGSFTPIPDSRAVELTLTVTNRSDLLVRGPVLAVMLSESAQILKEPRRLYDDGGLSYHYLLPDLLPKSGTNVLMLFFRRGLGSFRVTAWGGSRIVEDNYHNNRVSLSAEITDNPIPRPSLSVYLSPKPDTFEIHVATIPGYYYQLWTQSSINPSWTALPQFPRTRATGDSYKFERTRGGANSFYKVSVSLD